MTDNGFGLGFSMGVVVGLVVAMILFSLYGRTYEDGQVDCINGRINFELIKQPDGTTIWKYKEQSQ